MPSVFGQLASWVFLGTKVVGGLLATLTFVLYLKQNNLLYIPNPPGFPKTPKDNPPGFTSPAEWSVDGRLIKSSRSAADSIPFEDHFVTASDGTKIHAWLLLQPDSADRPTLLYFHGNAGNMGFRLRNAAEMYARVKMNILMMDYRGYGSSEGVPDEAGLNLDAEAVLRFAAKHPRLTNSRMIAFGRSLGGAVSVSLAHKHPELVSAVVVENTFLSVGAMVDVLMPYICVLKGLVLRIAWDSEVKIAELRQPVLFISGDSDQLVPPSHMKRLFEAAAESAGKVFFSVLGGTHNDTWEVAGMEYYRRIASFLEANQLAGAAAASCHPGPLAVDEPSALVEETAPGSNSDDDNVEDPDYLMVRNRAAKASLPTMNTNFQVK